MWLFATNVKPKIKAVLYIAAAEQCYIMNALIAEQEIMFLKKFALNVNLIFNNRVKIFQCGAYVIKFKTLNRFFWFSVFPYNYCIFPSFKVI